MFQKKIVRIITFSNYTEDSRPPFKSFNILDTYELNIYLTGIFMYWNYHGNLPAYFIQLNLSTTATLGTDESGRCGEVAVMGR